MRLVRKTYKILRYSELSEKAKENAKEAYLALPYRNVDFTDSCHQDLVNMFSDTETELNCQYSLSSCQGDGFNIYGIISAESILRALKDRSDWWGEDSPIKEHSKSLSDKEYRCILRYAKECPLISLRENRRYCYCLADQVEFSEEWIDELSYLGYRNINKKVIEKFEHIVRELFSDICYMYERYGYDYLYNISDEEMDEMSEADGLEYFEDGTLYDDLAHVA